MNHLRPKQLKFIEQYIKNGGNARRAYMDAYGDMKEEVADANASRLLSTDKVRHELDSRVEAEIDINSVIRTLDRKLKNHAESPKFSREEIQAIRLALEATRRIGSGHGVALQVNFQDFKPGESCPFCGFDGRTVLGEGYQELLKRGRIE